MQFALILLAALASLATSQSLDSLSTTNTTCKKYVIISTRGTFEPQGPSLAFPGIINSTMSAISNGTTYETMYPATLADNSSSIGQKDLISFIRSSNDACPYQRYILLGCSQGAQVIAGAMTQICPSSSEGQAILAVLTVGNPSHKPFQQANTDETGGKTTDMFFGSLYGTLSSPIMPDEWYASGKYLDICYVHDVVCMTTATALGDGTQYHVSYGNTTSVQQLGASFLVNRLYSAGLAPLTPQMIGNLL